MFRRRKPTGSDRLAQFWAWWMSRADAVAAAIPDNTTPALAAEISDRVHAMHPDLQWELGPGGPHQVELRQARVGVEIDDERQLLDVRVYHPMFASMPEGARGQITFLLLDWLLGEDGVVRWLGGIFPVTGEPEDSIGADALPDVVAGLMSRNDAVTWALLTGERDGAVVLVTARRPLKWIDYPLFDQHVGVTVGYTDTTPQGLPEPAELDRLRLVEDDLMAALGEHGLFVAHETSRGTRTWHMYADGEREDAASRVRAWTASVPGATVTVEPDPGWRMVRAFA
jgi:hypothetical protein